MSNLLYSLFRNYIFYRDTDSLGKIIKCLSWLKSAETGAEENAIFFFQVQGKRNLETMGPGIISTSDWSTMYSISTCRRGWGSVRLWLVHHV